MRLSPRTSVFRAAPWKRLKPAHQKKMPTRSGVFCGEIAGPRRDAIVLNAAGALKVGGKAGSFAEGIALADELIASGAAAAKLEQMREMSNSFLV